VWGVNSPADRPVAARLQPVVALSPLPLVVSPMAGGPSTVELVVAAGRAGALGFLAGGYKSADALTAEIKAVRAEHCPAFGVNLFVPGSPTIEPDALEAYLAVLEREAEELGATLGTPTWDDDDYDDKVEAVLAESPPMVSFTFGLPARDLVRELQSAGSLVALTITTEDEAAQALAAGPDCLCVQGAEAGAHRASFANEDRAGQDRPILELLTAVARMSDVPLIAAGGVGGPEDVERLIGSGAVMVQAGTAFLRSAESGAAVAYKDALADPSFRETTVTRAFSGRRARALVNAMVRDHPDAPAAYPEVNNATRPLRAAAARTGDTAHMSLYAGTGFRRCRDVAAGEVVEHLASKVRGSRKVRGR
jgi:nitronate monooxygenase